MGEYKKEYDDFLKDRQSRLKIVKTTKCHSGAIIDWIPIESQGEICTPPPAPTHCKPDPERPEKTPLYELQLPGADCGPEGTVPILRPQFSEEDYNVPLKKHFSKTGPPPIPRPGSTERESGAISLPDVTPTDGPAVPADNTTHCMFSPSVDKPGDFSLLQLSVARSAGAARPGFKGNTIQTLEAGWIKNQTIFKDTNMHLFTYFTACGYQSEGLTLGGWNETHPGPKAGWVQYDGQVHPGATASSLSTIGGPQYKLWLVYQLWRGNWWLWVVDRWIGYYPAEYFEGGLDAGGVLPAAADPADTLADHGDFVAFFGEVDDSARTIVPPSSEVTTTDMGSGQFAETGWQHSAYIHNILYQADVSREPIGVNDSNRNYGEDKTVVPQDSDTARYDSDPHFNSGGSWGSYLWLGGPGQVRFD